MRNGSFSAIIIMMAARTIVYVPQSAASAPAALDRFLPVYAPGMLRSWLLDHLPQDGLVLDPFGVSPRAALEVAQAGWRVLIACNNPVVAFELRLMASQPRADELASVFTELALQRKGSSTLEGAIRSLYFTRCASCGKELEADGFLWHKSESVPFARLYRCPGCGDSGEHPITDSDIQLLQSLQRSDILHRSMALEKVLGRKTEGRENVQEALAIYPARPLYVLFTLINKIDGMSLTPRKRDLLHALLLPVLDAGNAIWSYPEERERPRQLSLPATYIEKNLWMELERAVELCAQSGTAIPVTTWPETPRENGISLYPGRMRELTALLPKDVVPGAICCVFPRPNQAFWTLCALWSAWLWGREHTEGFLSVMDRRRFDWNWHTAALHSALAPAASVCAAGTPVFGILGEPVPGLVNAVIESTSVSNYALQGYAFKNPRDPIQMEWKTAPLRREVKPVNTQKIAREAMREVLQEIGEPTAHIEIHTAAMSLLSQREAFPPSIQLLTTEKAAEIQSTLTKLKTDNTFLRRMDATAQDPESGLWWLAQPEGCQTPLADRVELELLSWLQKDITIRSQDILPRLYQRFPGALTPPDDLIRSCLESYAVPDAVNKTWTIKDSDAPGKRDFEIEVITAELQHLSRKFNLESESSAPAVWTLPGLQPQILYRLFVSATAVIDRVAFKQDSADIDTIFILPGSRSGLLKFKIERDPYLRENITPRWHFLKFRSLRGILTRPDISLELWNVLMDSDPLSRDETTQLTMFQ